MEDYSSVRNEVITTTMDTFVTALSYHLSVNHKNFSQLFLCSVEDYMDKFEEIITPEFVACVEEIDKAAIQYKADGGWPLEKIQSIGLGIVGKFIDRMVKGVDDEIKSWQEEE